MKNVIPFARHILELTQKGELKWEDQAKNGLCFTAPYEDGEVIYHRFINDVETFVDVVYGFCWENVKVTLIRNETLEGKDIETKELLHVLEEIGFTLMPDVTIPEPKKTILDDILFVLYLLAGKKMRY